MLVCTLVEVPSSLVSRKIFNPDTGRPAWVGVKNDPQYRGKRLQQHILDELHRRSRQDGTLVQVVNGINYVSQRRT
jgi:hypothetical protein